MGDAAVFEQTDHGGQRQGAADAALLRDVDGAIDPRFRSGDHGLTRRVDVRHRNNLALGRFIAEVKAGAVEINGEFELYA